MDTFNSWLTFLVLILDLLQRLYVPPLPTIIP